MIRVRIGPPQYPFYAVIGNYIGRFFLDETAKTEVYCQINCVTITARIGAQRLHSLSPAMVTSSYKCNILAGFKENQLCYQSHDHLKINIVFKPSQIGRVVELPNSSKHYRSV